jgi:hypothetical protein
MIKKILKFFKKNWKTVLMVLVGAIVIVILVMALGGKKNASNEETVPTTTLSQNGPRFNPKNVSENDTTVSYTIEATYPVFKGIANTEAETKVNQLLADNVNGKIAAFKTGVAERKTNTSIPQNLKSSLIINYQVEYLSDKLVSILFNEESMLAGDAHPGHETSTFNYNLESNKAIALTDLFAEGSGYLTFLSTNTIKYLTNLNISNSEMIQQGAGADVKNYSNFYITDQAIAFVFDYYTVAPGAAGMQKVYFTFENLKNFLIQDGILKTLLVNNVI